MFSFRFGNGIETFFLSLPHFITFAYNLKFVKMNSLNSSQSKMHINKIKVRYAFFKESFSKKLP
jgi:hypothetical protein